MNRALSYYRDAPADAVELLRFGQPEHQQSDFPTELAAYTVVASMIYNLDEAITHE